MCIYTKGTLVQSKTASISPYGVLWASGVLVRFARGEGKGAGPTSLALHPSIRADARQKDVVLHLGRIRPVTWCGDTRGGTESQIHQEVNANQNVARVH